jgi:hypothetical protein
MNMCFDVPVKLYSFLLTGMGLYLTWPFLNNLYFFFFTDKPVNQVLQLQAVNNSGWRFILKMVKMLVVASIVFFGAYETY